MSVGEAATPAAPHFYIYTDIIQYQLVGDTQAPLLRIVPSEVPWQQITQPYYFRLNCQLLQSINIRICDAEGEEIDFAPTARVVCVLHFRRC